MDDPKWLAWRKDGITATDVADAANDTYGGAYGVVARKLGLIETEQTAQMDRGHRWEQPIADAVQALTGLFVVGEQAWCEHYSTPRYRATIDGLLALNAEVELEECIGILEVKTVGEGGRPNRDRWADQVQWQMLVTNMPAGVIAEARIDDVTDTCRAIHLTHLEADPFRQLYLCSVADDLWNAVQTETLPMPSASSLDAVKHVVTPVTGELDLSDIADDVRRFHEIKFAIAAVNAEKDEIEARIRYTLGEAKGGTCDGFKVSVSKRPEILTDRAKADLLEALPEYGTTVLDLDRLKDEKPELVKAAKQPLGTPRLTIKEVA